MSDAAVRGDNFLTTGDYGKFYRSERKAHSNGSDEAITAFTMALASFPTSPDFLIKRSMAYHKAKLYKEALSDCETAVDSAYKRNSKSTRALAQFRRRCVPG